jgi:DNA end-binding protein Ku
MARPLWSGSIQISLVGFAVEIYPATNTAKPFSFHEVDRNTLTRVRRQSVSAGPVSSAETEDDSSEDNASGHRAALHLAPQVESNSASRAAAEPTQHAVERADIVKGYEYEKDKYVIVEPAELKNLRLAGKKTIEISQFAKAAEIDPILYEKPYFVMPKAGPQATAFAVVRQSMRESGMVGVGEIVFSGRQHLMTLAPPQDPQQPGMMLYTLRFAAELRDAREYSNNLETVQADAAQLKLAKQLIEAYTQPFEVQNFKDHYEEALRELIEAKMNNLPVPEPEVEKKSAKVVDLMEALRQSLLRKPVQAAADATDVEQSKPAEKRSTVGASGKNASAAASKSKSGNPAAQAPAGKKSRSA